MVNLLTGLLTPTTGEVLFMGSSIAGIGPVRLADQRPGTLVSAHCRFSRSSPSRRPSRRAGVAPEKALAPVLGLAADEEMPSARIEVARIFGLDRRLESRRAALSQGEKKLLDVASAFALDPQGHSARRADLGRIHGRKARHDGHPDRRRAHAGVQGIVLVEHDMDLVAAYSHRIVALAGGRVLADLPPDRFFADAALIDAVVGKRRSD